MNPLTIYPLGYSDVKDIWAVLEIHDPKPYIDLVRNIRQLDDMKRRDKDADTFVWELRQPEAKESQIIEKIKTETGVDVRFEPSGTFYKQLAPSKYCQMPDPNLLSRLQLPRTMWGYSAVPDYMDRVKIMKCARLALNYHGIDPATKWNEIPHEKKMEAAQTLENTLQLGGLYEGWWLHMWMLKECRKTIKRAQTQSAPSGGGSSRGFSIDDICE